MFLRSQISDASSAGTLLQLNLGWGDGTTAVAHNIGRLRSQQISAPGGSFTQSYVYLPDYDHSELRKKRAGGG